MCLSVPGRVVLLEGDSADVDFGGIRRKASSLLCPDIREGDYVLVHVGFVIQRLEEKEAQETLGLFKEIERSCLDATQGDT